MEIDDYCCVGASAIGLAFLAADFLGAAFGAVVVWATASNAVIIMHRARLPTLQAVFFMGSSKLFGCRVEARECTLSRFGDQFEFGSRRGRDRRTIRAEKISLIPSGRILFADHDQVKRNESAV